MDTNDLSRRMWMARSLDDGADLDVPQTDGMRSVRPDDAEALAALMLAAYEGTIDFEDGATLDDARGEVRSWLAEPGSHAASVAVERDGRLVSACLVTEREEYAALAFVMTDRAYARQGLATAVMQQAMQRLRAAGVRRIRLGVTRANYGAVRVYERLGFMDDGPVE